MLTYTEFDDAAAAMWAENQTTALAEHIEHWNVPEYGSLDWLQMPAADPRRAAAVIEAAELWRRHCAEQARLDELAEIDPEMWWREITAEADAAAVKIAPALARLKTNAELAAARAYKPSRELVATPGWPPIAIPGRPGWYRHLINGKQADLSNDALETAA